MVTTATAQDYFITQYGAKGDGKTVNTKAIQLAIDACSKSGGKVIIPQGSFVSGTLFLKDNVTLFLQGGARLLGSTDLEDYPKTTTNFRFWGDAWTFQSLIIAHGVKNVSIEGNGIIDGRGASFPVLTKKKPDKYKNRPYLLWFAESEGIVVKDVELRNSAMWMQSYIRCDKLRIDGITVYNHSNRNNDMMDIDGCKDVIVTRVIGDSEDDGITLKSTCDRVGENISISNCLLSSHCNAIKFGTETTAGFRNVVISDCVVRRSSVTTTLSGCAEGSSGISIEMVDGGLMENVSIQNIVIDGPLVPLFVRLGNRARKHYSEAPEPGMGVMRNVSVSQIVATASSSIGCSVTGVPGGKVENFSLTNCSFVCKGGVREDLIQREIPELENLYPEANMFGTLPAYGLYVRHAKNIRLEGLSFYLIEKDARPAILLDDVQQATTNTILLYGEQGGDKVLEKKE